MSLSYSLYARLRKLARKLPVYTHARRQLLQEFNPLLINKVVDAAIDNVPFYARYKDLWNTQHQFDLLPIIRKVDVVGHEKELISRSIPRFLLHCGVTGGTSGVTMKVYNTPFSSIRRFAMPDLAYEEIGRNLRVAELRKHSPHNGAIYEDIGSNRVLLSSFQMTCDNVNEYVDILKHQRIECIHAYPSALMVFIRLIHNRFGTLELSSLKGILTSSEILQADDKLLIKHVLGDSVKIVDYFGQSEAVCAAYSVDGGPFIFNNNFGYVEFLDTGQLSPRGYKIAEIIATSLLCNTMTLIRFGTEDYVELDRDGNVVSIIGRRADTLVDKNGNLFTCFANVSLNSLKKISNYQFWQPEPGILVYKLVPTKDFDESDRLQVLSELMGTFPMLECRVQVVESISKTSSGKQMRVVRDFSLAEYR